VMWSANMNPLQSLSLAQLVCLLLLLKIEETT
jgi:hypothetical protein